MTKEDIARMKELAKFKKEWKQTKDQEALVKELAQLRRNHRNWIKEKYGDLWTGLQALFAQYDFALLQGSVPNIETEYDVEVEDFLPTISRLFWDKKTSVEDVKQELYKLFVHMFLNPGHVKKPWNQAWEECAAEISLIMKTCVIPTED